MKTPVQLKSLKRALSCGAISQSQERRLYYGTNKDVDSWIVLGFLTGDVGFAD